MLGHMSLGRPCVSVLFRGANWLSASSKVVSRVAGVPQRRSLFISRAMAPLRAIAMVSGSMWLHVSNRRCMHTTSGTDTDGFAAAESSGYVTAFKNGIVQVQGLSAARLGSQIMIKGHSTGLVISLQENVVNVALLDYADDISELDPVKLISTDTLFPVGPAVLGRVLDATGVPLDARGPLDSEVARRSSLSETAPGIAAHKAGPSPVLETGFQIFDLFHPVPIGSKMGIMGPKGAGKTQLALDIIAHQAKLNESRPPNEQVLCVYVSVGHSRTDVQRAISRLNSCGALAFTTVIAATENDTLPKQFLAPFAGAAIGAELRDRGSHALLVYDDFATFSMSYNRLSKLAPVPIDSLPYVQGRLLERSMLLNASRGGGSLTSIALVESNPSRQHLEMNTRPFETDDICTLLDDYITLDPRAVGPGNFPPVSVQSLVLGPPSRFQAPFLQPLVQTLRRMVYESYTESENQKVSSELGLVAEEDRIHVLEFADKFQLLLFQTRQLSLPEQIIPMVACAKEYLYDVPTDLVPTYSDHILAYIQDYYPQILDIMASLNPFEPFPQKLDQVLTLILANFHQLYYQLHNIPHVPHPSVAQ